MIDIKLINQFFFKLMSKEIYKEIQEEIESYGFTIVAKDFERPCGAFLAIIEEEAQDVANRFLILEMSSVSKNEKYSRK